ncbi:3682_t:CDS:2 [Acaulospora colombiana]|uniref:3682_t:CDS:1 n=1 Tax=Acaulospora colombiana TaxID=27376 RepID=A0ACA9KIK4_9GLOM|nr:3682_t:CDS:2 [Acaulospora colombiana]
MQNKASLPPIKFLLNSPNSDDYGYPSPPIPTSTSSIINPHAYHQRNLPSPKFADTDHLSAIGSYNKKTTDFTTQNTYNGSCGSLISPPESPGTRGMYQQLSPPPSLPSPRQQCGYCVGPSVTYDHQHFRSSTQQNGSFAQVPLSHNHHHYFHPRFNTTSFESMTSGDFHDQVLSKFTLIHILGKNLLFAPNRDAEENSPCRVTCEDILEFIVW